jgi:Rrf2 family protein
MKLSPAAELAIRGAVVLAQQYGKGPTTLADICELRDLSREYLARVFGLLAKADIVTPIRGKKGGYVLARDPRNVTLLEVIEAVEGPQALNLCQYDPPKCDRAGTCKVRHIWAELQETFENKLRSVTLAECL